MSAERGPDVDATDYLRRARICARVGDWNGLEEAALGLLGEARRLRAEDPRGTAEQGVGIVPDGGEVVARRDSPAWSDAELARLAPADQRKVTRLTDIEQLHLTEFGGGGWR